MQQRKNSIDMVNGPLASRIFLFALPLMASMLIQQLFNTADTIVVGRFAGPQALAAVGSCGYLVGLFVNFFMGFSMGTNVILSRSFGANDMEAVRKGVHSSVSFSALCGVLLGILGFFFAPDLLTLTRVPDDIIDMAVLYVRIYFLGSPACLVYNFGAAILRSQGDTKRPLYFLTAAGILNVGLNLIFVICFHMTTDGVALATILSQYLSAFLVIRCLTQETGPLHLDLRQLALDRHVISGIVRLGLPNGLESALYSISNMTVQSAINSFGSDVVAGSAAASSLHALVMIPSNSVNQAVLTFSGQNHGAQRYDRVDRVFLLGMLFSGMLGLVAGNLFYLFGTQLLTIYVGENAAVIQQGMTHIRCIFPYSMFCATMGATSCTLRGLGYSVIPMVVAILGTCGLRVVWVAFVLPLFNTTPVLFTIWPISWTSTTITLGIIFLFIRKKLRSQNTL